MDAVLLEGFIVAPLTSSLIRADSTETVVAGGPNLKVLVSRHQKLGTGNWELVVWMPAILRLIARRLILT